MRLVEKDPHLPADKIHDNIVGGHLHNTLVVLQYFVPVPLWVIFVVILIIGLGGLAIWLPDGGLILPVYLVFVAGDYVLLKKLPEKKISFAPVPPPLLIFSVGRIVAIALCRLLPFSFEIQLFFAGIIQMILSICAVWGMVIEPFRLQVTNVNIHSSRLQKNGQPVRLLHISDIHLERITRREQEVVRKASELKPDIIVLTGDFLNFSFAKDPQAVSDMRWFISQLSAPCGIYAVRGTFFIDLPDIVFDMLKDTGVTLLETEYRNISCNGHEFYLAGMPCSRHPSTDRPSLKNLLGSIPRDRFSVLLYHSPDLFPDAAGNVDLYLGGHTHGGQICMPFIGPVVTSSLYGRKYAAGLYEEDGTTAYISRGLGMEGLGMPRVRFMCPPELVLITLSN